MDFDPPADDDPRRAEVRAWLEEHPTPSPQDLYDAGLIVRHRKTDHRQATHKALECGVEPTVCDDKRSAIKQTQLWRMLHEDHIRRRCEIKFARRLAA